jgi:hypothetical protein
LARLYLVESALLGSVGIAGGVALGHWLSALIALRVPRFPTGGRNLSLVPMLFDTRVVLFAVALGALVVIVGTCIPAWPALRKPLMSRSHGATAVASGLPMRPTQLILAAELMVATVILVGAVFMGTGIWRYLNAPLGFDYANRLDLSFTMAEPRRPTAVEVDAVVRAVRQVGGVRMAAPYGGAAVRGLEVPGQSVDPQTVSAQSVSAGYGETWGVRVRRGRWFDPAEFTEHAAVVIVDEKFVRTVWPAGEPLGQVIKVAGGPPRQVIGVIEPMRWRLDLEVPGQAFVPAASPPTRADLVVWAPGAPVDLARRLDAAVSQALPGATTSVSPVTFDRLFQRSVGEAQFQAPIMAVFGLFAFVLAGVGVFGIVSYLVAQRIREFGIRLALGAGPRDLWRGVVRQSLVPAGIGLAVGVPAAWALERVVRSAAFGWPSTGIGAAVTVAILLFGITVIAAAAPARRAMSVDPVQVLRAE